MLSRNLRIILKKLINLWTIKRELPLVKAKNKIKNISIWTNLTKFLN